MIGGNVTEQQWQEVEAIVRKEQVRALQHMNTKRYQELGDILDHLYDAAHCSPGGLECKVHLTDD